MESAAPPCCSEELGLEASAWCRDLDPHANPEGLSRLTEA
jgi:hypothetical protein